MFGIIGIAFPGARKDMRGDSLSDFSNASSTLYFLSQSFSCHCALSSLSIGSCVIVALLVLLTSHSKRQDTFSRIRWQVHSCRTGMGRSRPHLPSCFLFIVILISIHVIFSTTLQLRSFYSFFNTFSSFPQKREVVRRLNTLQCVRCGYFISQTRRVGNITSREKSMCVEREGEVSWKWMEKEEVKDAAENLLTYRNE